MLTISVLLSIMPEAVAEAGPFGSLSNSSSVRRLATQQLRADTRKQKRQEKEISKQNKAQGRKGNREASARFSASATADPPADLPEALQPLDHFATINEAVGPISPSPEVNKPILVEVSD
jgi:hypothetical protein